MNWLILEFVEMSDKLHSRGIYVGLHFWHDSLRLYTFFFLNKALIFGQIFSLRRRSHMTSIRDDLFCVATLTRVLMIC